MVSARVHCTFRNSPNAFDIPSPFFCAMQAGRLIANLIVAGGGILIRAAAQAYRQALVSKSTSLLYRAGHHAFPHELQCDSNGDVYEALGSVA